jgi:nitroreductase
LTNPHIYEEDLQANAALIQNLQLFVWEKGMGIVWKTSGFLNSETFKTNFSS